MKKSLTFILIMLIVVTKLSLVTSALEGEFNSDNVTFNIEGIKVNQNEHHIAIILNDITSTFLKDSIYGYSYNLEFEFNGNEGVTTRSINNNCFYQDEFQLPNEIYTSIWLRDAFPITNYKTLIPGQEQEVLISFDKYEKETFNHLDSFSVPMITEPNVEFGMYTDFYPLEGVDYKIEYRVYSNVDGILTLQVLANDLYDETAIFIDDYGMHPWIEMHGESYYELFIGDIFTDEGFIATDTEDGDLTDEVIVSIYNYWTNSYVEEVSTLEAGYYQIEYLVYDSFGNQARQYRNINVQQDPRIPERKGSFEETEATMMIESIDITDTMLNVHYLYTGEINEDHRLTVQFNFNIEGNDNWPYISAESEITTERGVVSFNLDRLVLEPNVPAISADSIGTLGAYLYENDYSWKHIGSLQIREFEYLIDEISYVADYQLGSSLTYTVTNNESGALAIRVQNDSNNPDASYIWDLNHNSNGSLSDNFLNIQVQKVVINKDLGVIEIEYIQESDFSNESGDLELNLYTHFQANPSKDNEWNEWIYVSDRGELATSGVFKLPLKNAVQRQNMKAVYTELEDWNGNIVPNEYTIGFSINNYDNTSGWENYGYYSVNALLYTGDIYEVVDGQESISSDLSYTVGSLTYSLRSDDNNILRVSVSNSNYDEEAEFDHSIHNDFNWLEHNTFEITNLRINENKFEIDYQFNIDESITLDNGSYNLNVYTESEPCYTKECVNISLWGYDYLGEVNDDLGVLKTSGTISLEMTESNITSWYSYNLAAIENKLAEIKVDLSYWNSETYSYGYASFKPELTGTVLEEALTYKLKPYNDDEGTIDFTWQKNSDNLLELSWVNNFYDPEAPLEVPIPDKINISEIKLTEKFVSDRYATGAVNEEKEEEWSYFTILVEMEERLSGGLKLSDDPYDYNSWVGYAEGKYGEINYYSLFYNLGGIEDKRIYLEHWNHSTGEQEYIPLAYDGPEVIFKNNAFKEFSPMQHTKEQRIRMYSDEDGFLRISTEEIKAEANIVTYENNFDINVVWQRLGYYGEFNITEGETTVGNEEYLTEMYANFATKIELSEDGGETWTTIREVNFYDAEFNETEDRAQLIEDYMASSYTFGESTGLTLLPNTTYKIKISISSDYKNDSTNGELNKENPDEINTDNIELGITYDEVIYEQEITTGSYKIAEVIIDEETEVVVKEDGTIVVIVKSGDLEVTDDKIPEEQEQMDTTVKDQVNEENSAISSSAQTSYENQQTGGN
ncbi:DUF5011 domain-containing protein [Mycoplasmatota bacterium WC44]